MLNKLFATLAILTSFSTIAASDTKTEPTTQADVNVSDSALANSSEEKLNEEEVSKVGEEK